MSVGAVRDVKGFTIDQAKVRTWKRAVSGIRIQMGRTSGGAGEVLR